MNEEKKIAQAILDARRIYEGGYENGNDEEVGKYKKDFKDCCKEACIENEIDPNLYDILSFACFDMQDIQIWAKNILIERMQKDDKPLYFTDGILKGMCEMNEEKKIAQAIMDAHTMREESHTYHAGDGSGIGYYKLEFEECFIATCKAQGLSSNLWCLLNLANHWYNDIQMWAEDILAGRDIGADENCPCDSPSKEKCDQC